MIFFFCCHYNLYLSGFLCLFPFINISRKLLLKQVVFLWTSPPHLSISLWWLPARYVSTFPESQYVAPHGTAPSNRCSKVVQLPASPLPQVGREEAAFLVFRWFLLTKSNISVLGKFSQEACWTQDHLYPWKPVHRLHKTSSGTPQW